jgi:hypothetical protein
MARNLQSLEDESPTGGELRPIIESRVARPRLAQLAKEVACCNHEGTPKHVDR